MALLNKIYSYLDDVKKLIKTVPIIDPITKIDKTPRASGDLKPNLSIIIPKSGSRQIEVDIPIVSRLKPKSKATGKAIKVPKSPNGCMINGIPTLKTVIIFKPLEIANLAINTPINKTITPSATLDCLGPTNLIGLAK